MATATTFSSLRNDISKYLERGFNDTDDPLVYEMIPTFINDAERRVSTDLKLTGTINVVTSSFVQGQSTYPKPDRWRETVSMNYGTQTSSNTRVQLYPRSYEFIRMYHPDDSQQAAPKYYGDYNYSNIIVAPTPDSSYPFELVYYQLPPLLDDQTQTNWLTVYAPRLLRFACLVEATRFLKNDERIQTWESAYQSELSSMKQEDMSRIADRGTVRTSN